LFLDDEPDLDALFAEASAASGGRQDQTSSADVVDDEPTVEEDEPILDMDEDQAFSFLTDDEPASSKRSDDSEIRDVVSPH
jgi:hypothetical protein